MSTPRQHHVTKREHAAPTEPRPSSPLALLRLCHLVSPALPVGAYAYSQGLEYAVHAGWVHDEAARSSGCRAWSRHGLARWICRLLARLHRGLGRSDDAAAVRRWNAQLIAARETRRAARRGTASGRHWRACWSNCSCAKARLACERGHCVRDAVQPGGRALADRGARRALSGYLWAWSENQVLAAVKLVPLGQSAGQRLLHRLTDLLPPVVALALELPDEAVGIGALSQGLAAALHESQYSRLFRS